jgi:hypothetical protein
MAPEPREHRIRPCRRSTSTEPSPGSHVSAGNRWDPGIQRPVCNRATRPGAPEPAGTLNSATAGVAARVRTTLATPGIRVHSAVFWIERTAKLPNPAVGWATNGIRNIESGHVGASVAVLRIHGPFPRRVRAGGLAALRIRHCAGHHRAPAAGRARECRIRSRAGVSWLVCASTGSCWGPAVLFGWVWGWGKGVESLRRRPRAACFMGRGFGGQKGICPAGIRPWRGQLHCFGPR